MCIYVLIYVYRYKLHACEFMRASVFVSMHRVFLIACEEGHVDWPSTILIPAEKCEASEKRKRATKEPRKIGDLMGYHGNIWDI